MTQAHLAQPLLLLTLLTFLLLTQCDVAPSAEAKATVQIADRAARIPIIWPPFGKCCNTHNVYAVDTSGSMWGLSWSKVLAYLTSVSGSSDYTSLFTHGGTWSGPPFQVTNYYTHALNAAIPPALPSPYGDTDYDDALIRATTILNQAYPEKTCITFISDGWQEIYNSPVANVVQQFLDAKKNFTKKTGCSVCVKCYQTQNSTTTTPFQKFCQSVGVRTVGSLKALLDVDVDKVVEFKARAKLIKDPTDNGPRPDSAKDPK